MADPSLLYGVLLPTAAVAGFVRGFAGFGGPLLMLPVLNIFLPAATSIAVMMWVDLFANVRLLPDARRHFSPDVVGPLTLATIVAMPVGAYLLVTVDPLVMKRVISLAILVAALVLLTGWRYKGPAGGFVYAGVGALSGLVMGATSIAIVTALFLNAGQQTPAQSRANFIVWVFLATVLLIAILIARSVLGPGDLTMIAALSGAYLGGVVLGSRFHHRAGDRLVRHATLGLIVVVALGGAAF